MTTNKSWILDVQEDPETGDAYIQFPEDLLETAGWREGDTLEWHDLGNGSWQLKRKTDDSVTPEEEEAWRELEQRQTGNNA